MVDADAAGGSAGIRAGNGVDSFGILVGTDDTAEDFESGTLIAKVAQGNGAGQLAYQASELHSITYNGGTKTLSDVLSRYANNNSGGIITMKESAIYIAMGLYAGYTPEYIMTARDVLGAPVAIPDTGQLKVTYTINLVYPH